MDQFEFKRRVRVVALEIIRIVEELPHGRSADVLARQLVRSGCSIGANYRAACRARSKAEFIAKLGIVEEEADETIHWLQLLADSGMTTKERVLPVIVEVNEILALTVASIRTARGNLRAPSGGSSRRP